MLLLGALLFTSCTQDDLSDCPKQVRVHFTYLPGEVNSAQVDRMHLYIFDQNGMFVSEYRDEEITRFNTDYYIDLPGLLPGNYRIIAWGGKDGRDYTTSPASFVKGKTTFEEAQLMLQHPDNTISSLVHHLFHADLAITVNRSLVRQLFYMPLVQISNTINLSTLGLPATTDNYTFNITDDNCTYQFDRSFGYHAHAASHLFTYSAPCTKDEAHQLHATLHVLRLTADRRIPKLEVFNQTTGKVLYPVGTQSGDLIELILLAYKQNNFDTTHTYDIVLTFTGDESTGFKVDITINGWKVHDENTELID